MAGWVALHVVSPPSHDGGDVAGTVDVIALQVVDVGKFDAREIFVEASLCGREGTVLPRPSSNRAHSLLESAARSGVGRRHGVSMVDRTSSKHDTAGFALSLCFWRSKMRREGWSRSRRSPCTKPTHTINGSRTLPTLPLGPAVKFGTEWQKCENVRT